MVCSCRYIFIDKLYSFHLSYLDSPSSSTTDHTSFYSVISAIPSFSFVHMLPLLSLFFSLSISRLIPSSYTSHSLYPFYTLPSHLPLPPMHLSLPLLFPSLFLILTPLSLSSPSRPHPIEFSPLHLPSLPLKLILPFPLLFCNFSLLPVNLYGQEGVREPVLYIRRYGWRRGTSLGEGEGGNDVGEGEEKRSIGGEGERDKIQEERRMNGWECMAR